MADLQTTRQLEELRESLAEKLAELHRRATRAKTVLSPSTYWNNPWLRLGAGVAAGLAIGSLLRRPAGPGTALAVRAPAPPEPLRAALVRAGLTAAVSALVARVLAPPDPMGGK